MRRRIDISVGSLNKGLSDGRYSLRPLMNTGANTTPLRYCKKCGLGHPVLLTSVNGKPYADIYLTRGIMTDSLRTIQRNRAALSWIYFG